MTEIMKPLLAAGDEDINKVLKSLKYPLFASPKMDGIRGFNHNGVVLSRSLKPLPNKHLQETFGWSEFIHLDGEFIVDDVTDPLVFNKTTSVVMSHDKPIDGVMFHVFDHRQYPDQPYYKRYEKIIACNLVSVVVQEEIHNEDDLLVYEQEIIGAGCEGLILRDPSARYKAGRSTLREGILVKLKRFVDDEAVVTGFEEKMHNANDKTLVKNGKAARSSHAAGLVPLGTLGAVVVRWNDLEFRIGSGFDHAEAQRVWDNRELYLGKHVKFKYFPVGVKELPRHPVFLGWRDVRDMS